MEGSAEPFTPGLFVPNYAAQSPVPDYTFQPPNYVARPLVPNYTGQPFTPFPTGMFPVVPSRPPMVSRKISRRVPLKAPSQVVPLTIPPTPSLVVPLTIPPKAQIEKKDALSYGDYRMDAGVEKELRKKASDRCDGDKHDGDRLVKIASMISANLNRLEKNGEYVIEKARTLGEAAKKIRYSIICVDRLSGYEKSYFTLGGTLYELPYGDDINLSEYLVAELSRRIRMREDHKVVCDSSRLAYMANNRSFEPKFYEHRIHPSK